MPRFLSAFFSVFLGKNKFEKTFNTDTFEYHGNHYTVRDLSWQDRIDFQSKVMLQYKDVPVMSCAWLVSKGCLEFLGVSPKKIANQCSPTAIDFIAEKIIDISLMGNDAIEKTEKES